MPLVPVSGFLDLFSSFNLQEFLIRILVLCVSLSFHEMAHAWAAYRLGDDTAALQGRLTMNPLAHLDPIGSLMFLIGGIGWARPVPINPARFNSRVTVKKGLLLTSAAGPLSNLILASGSALLLFILFTIGAATGQGQNQLFGILVDLMQMLYGANLILAVFNLLPVPPLDGFKVFGSVLPNAIYYRLMSYERYIGIAFLVLIIFGRGILTRVLTWVAWPFEQAIWLPLQLFFSWFWRLIGLSA